MNNSSDPSTHQLRERQFMQHVEGLLRDDRLYLDTTRGRRPITMLIRDVQVQDKAVELRRLMSEMGKPDRHLQSQMPVGKSIEVSLATKKWWLFRQATGSLRIVSVSPTRSLIAGEKPEPMSSAQVGRILQEMPPPLSRAPSTIVIMSTAGFTPDVKELFRRPRTKVHVSGPGAPVYLPTVILASPNDGGAWEISGPPEMKAVVDLFDPEADVEKRQRIRAQIDASKVDLLSGGISTDRIASKTGLPSQLVESELKSYAKQMPGLTAKRLDGRVVLFREGGSPMAGGVSAGGLDMPFIEKVKALFSGKGEIEKKVAFLSERRAALSQQRDVSYDDMGALENKEGELRQQFKDAGGDITRRRITSQLVQLRKDIERRQQLLGVLNQQINVVSTHLHNLELQQQGETAKLPNSDEVAADAAAAEEVLAELEASSELADSVGSTTHAGMSDEEQALFDELSAEAQVEQETKEQAKGDVKTDASKITPPPLPQRPASTRQRSEPEAG
jgi:hypothetical protein